MAVTSASYQGVALIAPVTVPYSRISEHGAAWFIGRTLANMLSASGLDKSAVDGLTVSSFTLGPDSISSLAEHFGMELGWLEQIPLGGASGVVAMRHAARAIQAGDAEVIACIGGDTAEAGGFADLAANFSNFSIDAAYPYGAAGPNGAFSLITQHYMDQHGTQREDFGRIAIAQRYNANHYPGALFHAKQLDMQTYLDAQSIAGPVHLYDCVMPCAGADGFLVTSVERAQSLGQPWVEILASAERHNAFATDPVQYRSGWTLFRDSLYERAGLGPGDMQFLQTYDDYPVISMLQMEGLGFCEPGEATRFVRNTELTFDGGGWPGWCGGWLSRAGRSHASVDAERLGQPGARGQAWHGQWLRHGQL